MRRLTGALAPYVGPEGGRECRTPFRVDLTQPEKLAFYGGGKCVSERQALQDLLAKQTAKGEGQGPKDKQRGEPRSPGPWTTGQFTNKGSVHGGNRKSGLR